MASVFVARALPGDSLERLRSAHEVTVWDRELPPEPAVLRERVAEAEGLLCLLTDRVDGALLDAAPRLRAIANYAVGTDNIDLELTRARGIAVGVTPDVLTEATADLAFALLLAAARRLPDVPLQRKAPRKASSQTTALMTRRAWTTVSWAVAPCNRLASARFKLALAEPTLPNSSDL